MSDSKEADNQSNYRRLLSLDFMRGLIMILLAGEACLLYVSLRDLFPNGFANVVVSQFFHHPWHGLYFWDLVQPAFMTMAGAALYISYYYKTLKGITWRQNLPHIAFRCLKLFILGTALHCVYAGELVWELWNVLTQLSVTTFIAYLIIRKSATSQIAISVILLLVTEILYRAVSIPGFDQPFTEYKNFGSWLDTIISSKVNEDGWVAVNFIPTAAHTIWGALAGKILIQPGQTTEKIKKIVVAGVVGLAIGYGLDILNITPIIKRTATSSFVFASGGWVLLFLAGLHWLIDVKRFNRYAWIGVVVGMNAIFIYLFFETVGIQWLNAVVGIFIKGTLSFFATPAEIQSLISAIATLLLEWYLCYWLYKKRIFFKI